MLQVQRPFCSLWFCSAGVLRASEPKATVWRVLKTVICLHDHEPLWEGAPILILVDPYSTHFFPRGEKEVKVRKWWRADVLQTCTWPLPGTVITLTHSSASRPDGITHEEQGQFSGWRALHVASGSKIHIHKQVLPRTCSSHQHLQFRRYANCLQWWNAKKSWQHLNFVQNVHFTYTDGSVPYFN